MPSGEKQGRKKRGRYKAGDPAFAAWSDDERRMHKELADASRLPLAIQRESYARRAVEADRQCRELDTIKRTADEQRAFGQARREFFAALEALMLPDPTKPDDSKKTADPFSEEPDA